MKVCTDSCLFGAWLNRLIADHSNPPENALDIGTGTGLLSMMIAQENKNLSIDAIEIEETAFQQATENVTRSIFNQQIQLYHTSLQAFWNGRQYDLIFSNPPFFENDLLSVNHQKNMAKHDASLTFSILIDFIKKNLSITGSAAILIPYHRFEYLKDNIISAGLFTNQIVHVKQSPDHNFFRTMLLLSRKSSEKLLTTELTIKDVENNYTKEFTGLLQPFYLNM